VSLRRAAALAARTGAFAGALASGALALAVAPWGAASAQQPPADPIGEALAHEDARRWPQAAAAYRALLARSLTQGEEGDVIALALLGLERVWHEAALRDSILPVVEEVLRARPADPVARSIQFRSLSVASRDADLRRAFEAWRRAAPGEAGPWREYVRTLMQMGRALAADSALAEAATVLERRTELAGEAAQLATTLERWRDAAAAWRSAMDTQPWTETSATFALQRTPAASRDSVRDVLLAPPAGLPLRRLLATLETLWGDPRRGWTALSAIARDDSAAAAFTEFGERVEGLGAWAVAREVWTTLYDVKADPATGLRAASAALAGGDAAAALDLADRAGATLSDAERATRALPIAVRALGELGRAAEAADRVARADRLLDADARADLARPLVTAWLRAGEVTRAREVAERAGALDDDATLGWLALYDGNLAEARRRLVRAASSTARDAALTDALAVLARTRVESHAGLGAAFLTLARRDSAGAARRFGALADSIPDAAPTLLTTAARLAAGVRDRDAAVRYWEQVATRHGASPEAPEALLEWARALVRAGDTVGAAARYETLLLDHSGSAMVPQARRELERLRGRVPPAGPAHGARDA
jgi:hypothetical protein